MIPQHNQSPPQFQHNSQIQPPQFQHNSQIPPPQFQDISHAQQGDIPPDRVMVHGIEHEWDPVSESYVPSNNQSVHQPIEQHDDASLQFFEEPTQPATFQPSVQYFDPSTQHSGSPPPQGDIDGSHFEEKSSHYGKTKGPNDNPPPLLDELGVDFAQIWHNASAVLLNPIKPINDQHILEETDLVGPLLFLFLFGVCLLMHGKVHFGYVYGFGAVGCLGMWTLMNLMSPQGIALYKTVSALGYSLLPMIAPAAIAIIFSLNGWMGALLALVAVLWCSYSAAVMFVQGLQLKNQLMLVMYPLVLLYSCFALLAIF